MRFVFLCSLDCQMEGTLKVIKSNALPSLGPSLSKELFSVGRPVLANISVLTRNSLLLKTSHAEVKDSEWSLTLSLSSAHPLSSLVLLQ